ncbi:MAG: flagellar filament capping protein FliD [Planctomycetes bacterium]|nr:flagellar filament capping protein FliD [Planctomycetota bacterium]
MPSIQFSGLASGLDTQGIVSALVSVERLPIQRMQVRQRSLTSSKNLFGDLRTKATALKDLAAALVDPSVFAARKVSSSDETKLGLTVGDSAAPGSHDLIVSQRAAATRLASLGHADADASGALGSGTLSITVGSTVTDVTVAAGEDSLSAVRDAINAADAGVTASVVNDGSGTPYRLVITGTQSGLANAVSVDASGLSGGSQPLSLSTITTAQNAEFTLDGIFMQRPSNTVTDAIEGVTLELRDTTTAPLTIDVSLDAEASSARVKELVDGYNALVELINENSVPGEDGAPGGPLIGDFAASVALRSMRSAVAFASGSGIAVNLSSIGIATERDGSLKLDETKLSAAIESDSGAVASLVADAATRLESASDELGRASDGVFARRATTIDSTLRDLDRQIARREASLEKLQESLTRRFTALETLSARYQSQAGFLAALTGSNQQ